MAKTREEILALAKRQYAEVQGVRIQSLTELEMSILESRWANRYDPEDDEKVDLTMRRELLAVCIVDEDGKRVFKSDEVDLVGSLDSSLTKPLYRTARKLCGMDDGDTEKTAKKSSGTEG